MQRLSNDEIDALTDEDLDRLTDADVSAILLADEAAERHAQALKPHNRPIENDWLNRPTTGGFRWNGPNGRGK
jgi:hypothetical protein